MSNGHTPTEKSKKHRDNIKNATKNFDYTTIADRLRTVSWSNSSHSTGVVKPVYEHSTFPLTATFDHTNRNRKKITGFTPPPPPTHTYIPTAWKRINVGWDGVFLTLKYKGEMLEVSKECGHLSLLIIATHCLMTIFNKCSKFQNDLINILGDMTSYSHIPLELFLKKDPSHAPRKHECQAIICILSLFENFLSLQV